MSSRQLGKEVTSPYTVNKNKQGRHTFIKITFSGQPVLNFSFDMEKSHLFRFFIDVGDESSHTAALLFCAAIIT